MCFFFVFNFLNLAILVRNCFLKNSENSRENVKKKKNYQNFEIKNLKEKEKY